MMRLGVFGAVVAVGLGAGVARAAPCGATADGFTIDVSLHASNVGIGAVSCSYTGTDASDDILTINETWTSTGIGILQITLRNANGALAPRDGISVVKNIDNQSGADWTRLANELLDPGVDAEDPAPQPGFVPAGFSTSHDDDNLSFDQNGSIPRVSNKFADVFVDELTDARDFLDFFNGTIANGSADGNVAFGLDTGSVDNLPFLLVQRPNTSSREVPAPATLLLFGTALAAASSLRGRRR